VVRLVAHGSPDGFASPSFERLCLCRYPPESKGPRSCQLFRRQCRIPRSARPPSHAPFVGWMLSARSVCILFIHNELRYSNLVIWITDW